MLCVKGRMLGHVLPLKQQTPLPPYARFLRDRQRRLLFTKEACISKRSQEHKERPIILMCYHSFWSLNT